MIFSIRITIAIYFASPASAPVYFGNDFTKAEAQLAQYDSIFKETAELYHQDMDVLKAIVFPEFVRYSYLSDLLESFALEQVYTEYGSTAVDFSIGECQMKPSFTEEVEKHSKNELYFKKVNTERTPAARRERIERMKNIQWQLHYLAQFVKIAGDKFKLDTCTKQEKVRMLATIYNRGMHVPVSKLHLLSRQLGFPHGKRAATENRYAYAELSLLFLKRNAEHS